MFRQSNGQMDSAPEIETESLTEGTSRQPASPAVEELCSSENTSGGAVDGEEPAGLPAPSAYLLTRQDQITVATITIIALGLLTSSAVTGERTNPPLRSQSVSWQVEINSAQATELTVLRGVGPMLAARITEDRRLNGPFQSVNDLLRVRGLGPRTIEKNSERLRSAVLCEEPPRNDALSAAE